MDDLCDDISETLKHEPAHGPQKPPLEELLTVQEVADELRLDRRTVYRYLRQGQLRGQKLGGIWRIRRSALTAFLEARRHNVTETQM
jgi:excisionase family DNA binding protein